MNTYVDYRNKSASGNMKGFCDDVNIPLKKKKLKSYIKIKEKIYQLA